MTNFTLLRDRTYVLPTPSDGALYSYPININAKSSVHHRPAQANSMKPVPIRLVHQKLTTSARLAPVL